MFTFHVAGQCGLFERGVPLFQITDDPAPASRAAVGTSIVGSLRPGLPVLAGMIEPRKRTLPPQRTPPPAPGGHDAGIRAEHLLHLPPEVPPARSVPVEEVPPHRPAMQQHLPFNRPGPFNTMASGGLGFDLPGAVGFALADPTRRVVCLVGRRLRHVFVPEHLDGCATSASGHGRDRQPTAATALAAAFSQVLGAQNPPGLDLPGLDFVQLAAALGCPGVRVSHADELKDALQQACTRRARGWSRLMSIRRSRISTTGRRTREVSVVPVSHSMTQLERKICSTSHS